MTTVIISIQVCGVVFFFFNITVVFCFSYLLIYCWRWNKDRRKCFWFYLLVNINPGDL